MQNARSGKDSEPQPHSAPEPRPWLSDLGSDNSTFITPRAFRKGHATQRGHAHHEMSALIGKPLPPVKVFIQVALLLALLGVELLLIAQLILVEPFLLL